MVLINLLKYIRFSSTLTIAKWNTHTGKISNRFQRSLIDHVYPQSMLSVLIVSRNAGNVI